MWAVFAYTDWGQQIYVPCQPNMDTPEPVWCAGCRGLATVNLVLHECQ